MADYILKYMGPPGTAKTSTLLQREQEELARGTLPHEIVYCSFTRVAAEVAQSRAIEAFPEYKASDFRYHSTIHSICFNLLGYNRDDVFQKSKLSEFAKYYSYQLTATTNGDNDDMFKQDIQDMAIQTIADYYEHVVQTFKNSLAKDLREEASKIMKGDIPDGFTVDGLITYYERREDYKKEKGLVDFTDMLIRAYEKRAMPPSMKVVILDEAQDTFPAAFRVVAMWIKAAQRAYTAGDPLQCVYSFSAADPRLYINFPATHTETLKQSYRCPVVAHDLSRRIARRHSIRYPDDDYFPTDNYGERLSGINFDLNAEPTFWLMRTRYLINQTIEELDLAGIPYVAKRGKKNIFDKDKHMKRLACITLLNLSRGKHVTVRDLNRLMEYIKMKQNNISLFKKGAKKHIMEMTNNFPTRTVGVHDLGEFGFTFDFVRILSQGNPLDLLDNRHFTDAEKSYVSRIVGKKGPEILETMPNLTLSTFHGVKGSEAANVIVDTSLTKKPYYNLTRFAPDEEHRLFYVAVTRTSNRLVILPASRPTSYPL